MDFRSSTRLGLCWLVGLVSSGAGFAAGYERWPMLEGASERPECVQALRIAESVFRSTSPGLYYFDQVPQDFGSTVVLKPRGFDISGGDELLADPSVFAKVPNTEFAPDRSTYWEIAPRHGHRLAVRELYLGWRGDTYSLYAIDSAIDVSEFMAQSDESGRTATLEPITSGMWRPPVVFRRDDTDDLWVLQVGPPAASIPVWWVFAMSLDGLSEICRVRFGPDVKNPSEILPRPVRRLARLLDEAIGPGSRDGTLQQTARLRVGARRALANAALRPWALYPWVADRAHVDAGLAKWARQAPSFRAVHDAIVAQYPIAERALADYYRAHPELVVGDADADAAAKRVLGLVYRSHFVFPSGYGR